MSIAIRPLVTSLAGDVSGLDTTRPISREEVTAIERGMVNGPAGQPGAPARKAFWITARASSWIRRRWSAPLKLSA